VRLSFYGVPEPDDTITVVLTYSDLAAQVYETGHECLTTPYKHRTIGLWRLGL